MTHMCDLRLYKFKITLEGVKEYRIINDDMDAEPTGRIVTETYYYNCVAPYYGDMHLHMAERHLQHQQKTAQKVELLEECRIHEIVISYT